MPDCLSFCFWYFIDTFKSGSLLRCRGDSCLGSICPSCFITFYYFVQILDILWCSQLYFYHLQKDYAKASVTYIIGNNPSARTSFRLSYWRRIRKLFLWQKISDKKSRRKSFTTLFFCEPNVSHGICPPINRLQRYHVVLFLYIPLSPCIDTFYPENTNRRNTNQERLSFRKKFVFLSFRWKRNDKKYMDFFSGNYLLSAYIWCFFLFCLDYQPINLFSIMLFGRSFWQILKLLSESINSHAWRKYREYFEEWF